MSLSVLNVEIYNLPKTSASGMSGVSIGLSLCLKASCVIFLNCLGHRKIQAMHNNKVELILNMVSADSVGRLEPPIGEDGNYVTASVIVDDSSKFAKVALTEGMRNLAMASIYDV